MRWESGDAALEVMRGDITQQQVDAVVNAANSRLAPGGGVAGAIHRAAGRELWEACEPLGGCATGEAKVTDGFRLPARWIVHTVGPVYGQDEPSDQLLAQCYRESLAAADELGAQSIAFPALSTGAFGYPMAEATEIALSTLLDQLPQQRSIKLVRMVLFGDSDLEVHQETLSRLAGERGWQQARA
jgi:O-acetyl-ADP-ribose deacetylase (regulator of RNase III)